MAYIQINESCGRTRSRIQALYKLVLYTTATFHTGTLLKHKPHVTIDPDP